MRGRAIITRRTADGSGEFPVWSDCRALQIGDLLCGVAVGWAANSKASLRPQDEECGRNALDWVPPSALFLCTPLALPLAVAATRASR